jgi:Transglutaminase-like superfamily
VTEISWRLELEAAALLVLARLAIRFVPFRWLVLWFERPTPPRQVRGAARAKARREVRHAVFRASRWLPGKTVCFPRAIASQTMLRRRGVAAVLYCGATSGEARQLSAHVWVKDGQVPIVGVNSSRGYLALASYPTRSS